MNLNLKLIKVKIWDIIKTFNPVWYFDATGSIMKKMDNKEPFLYSIVCYDRDNKQIVSIADFMTLSNTSLSISKYLFSISTYLSQPKIIVTDQCSALINAGLLVFNKFNIVDYLIFSYNAVFNKNIEQHNFTIFYMCAAHFIKNIIKKVNKFRCKIIFEESLSETKLREKKVKKLFIFCFALIQNSININDLNNFLLNIFVIFKSQFATKMVNYSIGIIRDAIKSNDIDRLNDIFLKEIDKDILEENINAYESVCEITKDTIRNSSPFTYYYNDKLRTFEEVDRFNF